MQSQESEKAKGISDLKFALHQDGYHHYANDLFLEI